MRNPSTYIIGGPPRTGTTWTYNVLRALLSAYGAVYPQDSSASIDIDGTKLTALLAEEEANPDRQYVIKTHHSITGPYVYILNRRDWSEVVASFAQFMHMDAEQAETHLEAFKQTDEHYTQQSPLLVIEFHEVGTIHGIRKLAEFAGLIRDDYHRYQMIQCRFSKASVEQLTAVINDGYTMTFTDGTSRKIDRKTGFHEGHIQCS